MCPPGFRLRSRLAQPLDDGGVVHAGALAHRLQAVPTTPLFERVDKITATTKPTTIPLPPGAEALCDWDWNADGLLTRVFPISMTDRVAARRATNSTPDTPMSQVGIDG